MDISFVISATAIGATTNFKTMKDIVKAAAERFGTDRLRYSVTVFGNTPNVQLQFTAKFPSDEDFKSFVHNIRKENGRALDTSLEKARMLLERDGRPNAKKVSNVVKLVGADTKQARIAIMENTAFLRLIHVRFPSQSTLNRSKARNAPSGKL